MDLRTIHDILSGRRKGAAWSILRGGLGLAGGMYAAVMAGRRWAYRRGLPLFRVRRPAGKPFVPVLCVGNITTGGTGKTPMVAWLVAELKRAGRKPAILTRGYKARHGKSDEAVLLSALHADVPVFVNADRLAAAAIAIDKGADVLVMDDGFQHRRLVRDLDIVLIDALEPFGFGHCLPRGLLREPVSALADADAIVITHSDLAVPEDVVRLEQTLRNLAPRATIHMAAHLPAHAIDQQGSVQPSETLRGRKVFAFCGLGNPDSFFAMVERLGAAVVGRRAFPDHAAYDAGTIQELSNAAVAAGADILLTTQKDFVKLAGLAGSLPIWQLAIRMEVILSRQQLLNAVSDAMLPD